MNNTSADGEFDPASRLPGAPAGSTNSSDVFDLGFDDEFDSEVNFKPRGAGSIGSGGEAQSLLRLWLTMRAITMAGLEILFERCFQKAQG